MQRSDGDQANQLMVDRLIAEGALWSRVLIAAFRSTPRHRFLHRVYQYQRRQHGWREVCLRDAAVDVPRLVYADRALITRLSSPGLPGGPCPISSSSQPSLMAQMLEDLKLQPGLRTLEIGAGTGYNAALMAHVTGPDQVTTVDVDAEVLAEAREHLAGFSERGIELIHTDGRLGLPGSAPFDRIMVTASTPDLEPAWLDQLHDRGLLLAPLTLAPGLAYIVRGTVSDGVYHGRPTRAAYFMPLRAEGEVGGSDSPAFVPDGERRTMPAPWAGWFDRRKPRLPWIGFVQALVFYGLLKGLAVHYRVTSNGGTTYGVSQGEALCWFGVHDWATVGTAGRDLGWSLWRAFLDAGGPWPTDFRFKASPAAPPPPSRREFYARRGPRCYHLWEMLEPGDRPMWI